MPGFDKTNVSQNNPDNLQRFGSNGLAAFQVFNTKIRESPNTKGGNHPETVLQILPKSWQANLPTDYNAPDATEGN